MFQEHINGVSRMGFLSFGLQGVGEGLGRGWGRVGEGVGEGLGKAWFSALRNPRLKKPVNVPSNVYTEQNGRGGFGSQAAADPLW